MHITSEQREERFQNAPEAIQELYSSSDTGEKLAEVFEHHQFPREKYASYVRTVGDIMLGFYPKSQLAALLQQNLEISAEQASAVEKDLQGLLESVTAVATPSVRTGEKPSPQRMQSAPMVGYSALQERREGVPPDLSQGRPAVPPYQKPLTDTPRYTGTDPYHESTDKV